MVRVSINVIAYKNESADTTNYLIAMVVLCIYIKMHKYTNRCAYVMCICKHLSFCAAHHFTSPTWAYGQYVVRKMLGLID